MAAANRGSPPPASVEVRYSPLHNFSLSLLAALLMLFGAFYISRSDGAPTASAADPRFMLFVVMGFAMFYYAWIGVQRALNRSPQVTIDGDGIVLGFGRNRRFAWDEVQWVRIHRIAVRPVLQIGFSPVALAGNVLRLSTMSFDDALRPVRGMPGAVAVRDNGLDMRTSAMLDAVRKFRPDLVKS
jgi:hypothetical protein